MKAIKVNKIFNSDFAKNISYLVSGTALAQLIPILIQPILRRFYSIEIFAAYAVYMSIIGILYAVPSFRYEQAIIIPKKNDEAINILSLAQFLNLVFCILIGVIVLIFHKSILTFLNINEEYKLFILLVPITIFLFNFQQSINLWLIRNKSFKSVSRIKIVRRSTEGVFQTFFRFINYPMGILIGDIFGHIANILFGVSKIIKTGFIIKNIQPQVIKTLAKRYSEYPKFNTLSSLLSASSLLLPTIFINKFYGAESAAFFDLARLLLLTPIALIASSISNVMLQRISEKRQNNLTFMKELISIIIFGLVISFLEILILLPFGEELFSILFGESWSFSGYLSKILLWPFAIYFFTISLSSIFLALGKIKELSIIQSINFLLVLSLVFFKNKEFIFFLRAYIMLILIGTLIFVFILQKVVKTYNQNLL